MENDLSRMHVEGIFLRGASPEIVFGKPFPNPGPYKFLVLMLQLGDAL